jgi:hypothetical protein
MYERAGYREDGLREGMMRLGNELIDWLRRRPAEQWLMFTGGLVLGLLIG